MLSLFSKSRSRIATLRDNNSGSALIEFALLAPVFLILFFGVFQVAVYLQNYNAVKSLASDGSRYVMVEYQKNNTLADEQIESVLLGEAVNAPYLLDTDRLIVEVDRSGVSRIAGATEIEIGLTYQLPDIIPGLTLPLSTITYDRPVFVVTS